MPEEYSKLSTAYDALLAAKLPSICEEFGEAEIAHLLRSDKSAYDALREEGRLAIFERENTDAALAVLVLSYEDQAQRATEAGAFLAGCLMWGAAAEARLLLHCLREPKIALAARDSLAGKGPRRPDPTTWTLEHLVMVAAQAGWLGTIEDNDIVFFVEGLISQLRTMRNLVHPGRCSRKASRPSGCSHVRRRARCLHGSSDYREYTFRSSNRSRTWNLFYGKWILTGDLKTASRLDHLPQLVPWAASVARSLRYSPAPPGL